MIATTATRTRVHIRWMIQRDMPEILAIENASFAHPWCEEEFLRVRRQRNCIGMVAEHGERIVGFMVYELRKGRIELLRLATHRDFRHHGVGRQMIDKLVGKLDGQHWHRIGIFVRESNLAAQLFLRACGLRAARVDRGRFADTGEDAYRMTYALATNL